MVDDLPLVSCDINHNPHSSTFDATLIFDTTGGIIMVQEIIENYKQQEVNPSVDLANKPIPVGRQIMYSFSELASNPVYTIMMTFLLFYYTDVLGISAALIGTVILISKIFDGISDLIAGNIIDHTNTKKGSARPWVLRAALPLAISLVLLFTVPDVSVIGKLVYIFVTYNFSMSVCFTLFGAATNVLPLYATNDSKSKSTTFAIRLFVAAVIQLVLTTTFMTVIDYFGGGQRAWILFAVILAIISLISSIFTYFSLEEHVQQVKDKDKKTPLLVSLKALLQNKYWIMIIGLFSLILFHQIITLTVGVYYAKYILNDAKLVGAIALYHGLAMTVVMFFVPFMLQKGVSKKKLCVACGIIMLVGSIIGSIGTSTMELIISLAMRGVGFGIIAACIAGMLADSLTYGDWKTGVSSPAVGMAAFTFVQKVAIGVATAAFGLLLSLFGYDGLVAVQPASAVMFIKAVFLYIPIILYVLLIVLLYFYNLDKEMPQILKDLDKRRATKELPIGKAIFPTVQPNGSSGSQVGSVGSVNTLRPC